MFSAYHGTLSRTSIHKQQIPTQSTHQSQGHISITNFCITERTGEPWEAVADAVISVGSLTGRISPTGKKVAPALQLLLAPGTNPNIRMRT